MCVDPSGYNGVSNTHTNKEIIENFQSQIDDIRNQMPNNNLKNRGNMAMADVEIDGLKNQYVAHSQINSLDDKGGTIADFSTLKLEEDRTFTSYVDCSPSLDIPPYARYIDTEAKILEDIASSVTDQNTVGKIILYTEKDCCQSCTNVIFEFKNKYPNIDLKILSNSMKG